MAHHWTLPPGSVIFSKKPDCKKQPDGSFLVTYHFAYRSDHGLGFDWFDADALGDACCRELEAIERRWKA